MICVCLYIHVCLGPARFFLWQHLQIQHRRCTNPEFMSEGEQSSMEAGALNGPR